MERRHVSKRPLLTVAIVVKISLYDREAEWLAGMPDELVLMHPGPAGVAENGAAVGLSSELQAEVVALEAGNAVGQRKDTPDPVTGHCGNTILGQGCGAFDPRCARVPVQSLAQEAHTDLIGGKSVLFSKRAAGEVLRHSCQTQSRLELQIGPAAFDGSAEATVGQCERNTALRDFELIVSVDGRCSILLAAEMRIGRSKGSKRELIIWIKPGSAF